MSNTGRKCTRCSVATVYGCNSLCLGNNADYVPAVKGHCSEQNWHDASSNVNSGWPATCDAVVLDSLTWQVSETQPFRSPHTRCAKLAEHDMLCMRLPVCILADQPLNCTSNTHHTTNPVLSHEGLHASPAPPPKEDFY